MKRSLSGLRLMLWRIEIDFLVLCAVDIGDKIESLRSKEASFCRCVQLLTTPCCLVCGSCGARDQIWFQQAGCRLRNKRTGDSSMDGERTL